MLYQKKDIWLQYIPVYMYIAPPKPSNINCKALFLNIRRGISSISTVPVFADLDK